MRYYLDTEFDGHNGPLLSIALVEETGISLHVRTTARASDPWVRENVEPHMGDHNAHLRAVDVPEQWVGDNLRQFLRLREAIKGRQPITIIADSVVDIARFCCAISTDRDGNWCSVDGDMSFEVRDVSCYPTDLPGAVQHNAWWDAMALRHLLQNAPTSPTGQGTLPETGNSGMPPSPDGTSAARQHGMNPLLESDYG
jgi:hypothetical protein